MCQLTPEKLAFAASTSRTVLRAAVRSSVPVREIRRSFFSPLFCPVCFDILLDGQVTSRLFNLLLREAAWRNTARQWCDSSQRSQRSVLARRAKCQLKRQVGKKRAEKIKARNLFMSP